MREIPSSLVHNVVLGTKLPKGSIKAQPASASTPTVVLRPRPGATVGQRAGLTSCTCCAGRYLEIFGRKNNLHNYWVTVGNEVTGTGLPKEDIEALAAGAGIPSAVFGRSTAKSTELESTQA